MSNEEKKPEENQTETTPFESVQEGTKEPILDVPSTETIKRPDVEIDVPKQNVLIFDGTSTIKQTALVEHVGEFAFDTKGLDDSEIERIQANLDAIDSSMAGLARSTKDVGRFSMALGKAVNDLLVHEDWRRFYNAAEKRNCENAREFFGIIMPSFSYARLMQVRKGYHFTESLAEPFEEMGLPKYLGELHARYGHRYLYSPVYNWALENAPAGYSEAKRIQLATDLAEAAEQRAWQIANENVEKGKAATADDIAFYSRDAIRQVIAESSEFGNKLLDWNDKNAVPKQPKFPKGVQTRLDDSAKAKRKELRDKAIAQGLPIPADAVEPEPVEPEANEPPRLREDVFPIFQAKIENMAGFLARWKKRRTTKEGVQSPDFDSNERPLGLDKDEWADFEDGLTELDLITYEMATSLQHYRKVPVADQKVDQSKVQTVKPKEAPNTAETRVTAKP